MSGLVVDRELSLHWFRVGLVVGAAGLSWIHLGFCRHSVGCRQGFETEVGVKLKGFKVIVKGRYVRH